MNVIAPYAPYSMARSSGSLKLEIGRLGARQPAAAADGPRPETEGTTAGGASDRPVGRIAVARHNPRQRPQPGGREPLPGPAQGGEAGIGRQQAAGPAPRLAVLAVLGMPGLASAAFLAQQVAQSDSTPEDEAGGRSHEAAVTAYRAVAERGRTFFGPVLAVSLTV